MMTKKFTCIECPKGCRLTVDIENNKVLKVSGNECPKGEKYAISEIENPVRILTSAVLCLGLNLKMVSVRTDKPIPKSSMFEAMSEIKKIRVAKPLKAGDIIVKNFLGLDANLVSTRKVE
jgi:CxxC motif-containing protein